VRVDRGPCAVCCSACAKMRSNSRGGGTKQAGQGMYPAMSGVCITSQPVWSLHSLTQLQSFASQLFQLGTVSNQADPLPVLSGTSTPASPAVLSLCSVYGHACLLQPIYGYAGTRHGPHWHDAFKSGPSKPIRSCCSAWVQQPTTIQATASRCHKSTQLRRTTEFTAVAYKYVLCNTTKQHSLLLVAREV